MSTRRSAIGTNPLDALISGPAAPRRETEPVEAAPRPAPRRARRPNSSPDTTAPETAARMKATYLLPAAVVDRARNAAVALAAPPARLTLAALVTSAITREVDRLERLHNAGKPFPHYGEPLVGGRPIGSTRPTPAKRRGR